MVNLDLELIVLVFFWLSLWGLINTVIQWIFKQMGQFYNPGTSFLVYLIIFLGSLIVFNNLIDSQDSQDEDEDDEDNNNII